MTEERDSRLKESLKYDSGYSQSYDQSTSQEISQASIRKSDFRAGNISDSIRKFPNAELKFYSEGESLIGSGGFGKVRKYHHKDKIVAIKEFDIRGNEETIARIWNLVVDEANILYHFHHENIVEVLGITQWPNAVGIIMEYVDGGNLYKLLHEDNQSELLWNTRLEIARGISSALAYTHKYGKNITYCHGDVKPSNILLTKTLQVKLVDFASAAFHHAVGTATATHSFVPTNQLSLIYVAPEFFKDMNLKRNPAMDMYSFGMVLYELISRKAPYSDCSAPTQVASRILGGIKPTQKLIEEAKSQLKSDDDRSTFNQLRDMMERCWNDDPDSRPSSKTVNEELGNYLVKQQDSSSQNLEIEAFGDEAVSNERTNIPEDNLQLSEHTTSGIDCCTDGSGDIELPVPEYPGDEFEFKGELSCGGFAKVLKYYHKKLGLVAIKKFEARDSTKTKKAWKSAYNEAFILHLFHHQNIVEVLGIAEWTDAYGIIMECCDGGDLNELLSRNVKSDLSWETRLQIAEEVVTALSYIHNYGKNEIFCHGDLKPHNVLLTKLLKVKLADFGGAALNTTSRDSFSAMEYGKAKQFTLVYVAPEFLKDTTQNKNPAMDMYSFGMILYHMICRRAPYSDSSEIEAQLILDKSKPSDELIVEAENQLQSDKDRAKFDLMRSLMQRCWNDVPDLRPSSKEVEMELKDFPNKLQKDKKTTLIVHETKQDIKQSATGIDAQSDHFSAGLEIATTKTEVRFLWFQMMPHIKQSFPRVGKKGGTLEAGGCRLVIPEGALDAEVTIKLTPLFLRDADTNRITPLLKCEPKDLKFLKEVEVILPTCFINEEEDESVTAVVFWCKAHKILQNYSRRFDGLFKPPSSGPMVFKSREKARKTVQSEARRSDDEHNWEEIKLFDHRQERNFMFPIQSFSFQDVVVKAQKLFRMSLEKILLCGITHQYSEDSEHLILSFFLYDSNYDENLLGRGKFRDFFKQTLILRKHDSEVELRLSSDEIDIPDPFCKFKSARRLMMHQEEFRLERKSETSDMLYKKIKLEMIIQSETEPYEKNFYIKPPEEPEKEGFTYFTNMISPSHTAVGNHSSV